MHEIGIVDDVICAINAKLKGSKGNLKVLKINILVGGAGHISQEHFEFHFRERTKGTLLENAELAFKKTESAVGCIVESIEVDAHG